MLTQDYAAYTAADQDTWTRLHARQMPAIHRRAYRYFNNALTLLRMNDPVIPQFSHINQRLARLTGWTLYAVPGLIDNAYFFEQMQYQRFGATTWLRKPEQLDYLEEPDMFHDVFGSVPLLADPRICTFLTGLASLAADHDYQPDIVEAVARLYWYTIEFGLIRERDELKIYGAGILSSVAETQYCLSGTPRLLPFDVKEIITTPYIKDSFQAQYFVLENLSELNSSLRQLECLF